MNRGWSTFLVLTWLLLFPALRARGDYLEVRRDARIVVQPASGSQPVRAVEPGDILILVKLEKVNGYYKVRVPGSNQTGFIFRTFGRGFRGDPPNFTEQDIAQFRARHLSVGAPEFCYERVREGYAVGYDSRLKIPAWVQYEVSPDDVTRTPENEHVKRKDDFRPDITMPRHTWAANRDYQEKTAPNGEAFAKGHMAPAADMIRSERVMSESFYLSNMVPQVGDRFNGSVWEDLERDTRKWVQDNGPVTIIVGPAFEARPEGNRNVVRYQVIGDDRVAVPTHLFKIIVDNRDPQTPRALAFLMENRPYDDDESYKDHLVAIDRIEALTGLDFLDRMDDGLEAELESEAAEAVWWNDDTD